MQLPCLLHGPAHRKEEGVEDDQADINPKSFFTPAHTSSFNVAAEIQLEESSSAGQTCVLR